MIPHLAVIDQQTLLDHAEVQNAVKAIQIGVSRDFAHCMGGTDAVIRYITDENQLAHGEWPFFLVDDVPNAPAGALAWHAQKKHIPYGIVPVKINLDNGADPYPSLDHEVKEALGDPMANAMLQTVLNGQLAFVARENCDPVENDLYHVTPQGGKPVSLSNFVFLPLWAHPTVPAGTKLDFLGKLTAPLTITPGGYFSYYENGQWNDYPAARMKHPRSRWARRRSTYLP